MNNKGSYLTIFVPWLVVFLLFTFAFAGYNAYISFVDWQGLYPSYNFAGLSNYLSLPSMSGFYETLVNTGLLFGVGIPLAVLTSVILAILMDAVSPKVAFFFRTIAIASMAVGGVMVAIFWYWMYNFSFGGVNDLLRVLSLDYLVNDWLGNSTFVLFAVILMLIWKFSGYGGLIVLGGLQGVPEAQIESARLDGASTFQIYRYVLLPQVRGHILTIGLLLSMFMLKSFGYIWPLTGGGPGWSSTLFPVLVYRKIFEQLNYSGGAAVATLLFFLVALIALPYLYFNRSNA